MVTDEKLFGDGRVRGMKQLERRGNDNPQLSTVDEDLSS
jgi:hypothetical protein